MSTVKKARLRSPKLVYDIELLRAMADETRQRILQYLCTPGGGRMISFSVTDIAENFELTASTVSHHLQLLRRCNLVVARKEGKERKYALNFDRLRKSVGEFDLLLQTIEQTASRAAAAATSDADADEA